MALKVHIDETSCGPLCQHPSCWQSNIRQEKGFPKLRPTSLSMPDIKLDLPTVKVCNMLEDYGESPYDKYPLKFVEKPTYENNDLFSSFQKPIRTQSVKGTRAPQTSPKSGMHAEAPVSTFKVVEVQEIIDPKDLAQTWDDTSFPKSYYVWVLNPKKKRQKRLSRNIPDASSATHLKDMTEDMIPREIDNSRLTGRPLHENHKYQKHPRKKKGATFKPNLNLRSVTMSPRTTRGSSKMEFDHEGQRSGQVSVPIPTRLSGWHTPGQVVYLSISELLALPRDILIQVLDNTRQSDLMSREKIKEIIRNFMPTPIDRGNTNISLASSDVLQQKKLSLHEGNKNVRQPQYIETKPVFYLDNEIGDAAEDDNIQAASPYGSLKDQYPPRMDNSHEINRYKKPLPAITENVRATSAGDGALSKIPSISLGLPALPSGIKHTKPFTYSKNADFDFTLGPIPTPPTSIKSSSVDGSVHGSPLKVSLLSQTSNRSDTGSDLVESATGKTPESLHTMSPSFLTRVPKPPSETPASYHQPIKHTPLLREMIGSSSVPQEWPPKDNSSSPLQIMRAPVNTPGSILPELSGLGTIHENISTNEDNDQTHPVSQGRSVRFEIPEVPPPPSSPQNSEDSLDAEKDDIHVIVDTVNPASHAMSSNKPTSGATIRTDVNTINTSLPPHENSFILSNKGPVRELSMISTPEPWPQVNEDDFNICPAKTPEIMMHQQQLQISERSEPSENRNEFDNNMLRNVKTTHEKQKVLSTDSENDKDYLNMTSETSGNERNMIEELRKEESPAPPPPSPEAKEDNDILYINQEKSVVMTTLIEESENEGIKHVSDNDIMVTVMHVSSQSPMHKTHEHHFQIDTFQTIDIPASLDQSKLEPEDTFNDAETERSAKTPDYIQNNTTADVTIPVPITSENTLLSESDAQIEVSNSAADAVNDQETNILASTKENESEMQGSVVPGDWSGQVESLEDKDVDDLLNSEQQDLTVDGGEHEDYKEDLRQEYEKLSKEPENV